MRATRCLRLGSGPVGDLQETIPAGSQNGVQSRLQTSFSYGLVLLGVLCVSAGIGDARVARAQSGVLECIRFDPDDIPVFLPLHIGDKEYRFIMDFGCSRSFFGTSLTTLWGSRLA